MDPSQFQRGVDLLLMASVLEAQRQMQDYPPWRPWKNPPKTGPHAGGRRTGTYGRNWTSGARIRKGKDYIELVNPTPYAPYVGGRHGVQARALEARGWKSVSDISLAIVAALRATGKLKISP